MSLAKAEAAKPDRIVLRWRSGWAGGGGPAGEDSLYHPPGPLSQDDREAVGGLAWSNLQRFPEMQ